MKKTVRVLSLLLVIILIFSLVGCENFLKRIENDGEQFVEFSNESDDSVRVSATEIKEYQSEYSYCNSTFYRDQLEGDDLLLYNTLLYAMEHSFTDAVLFVEDPDMDPFIARECLSLDSPFLEQNYTEADLFYTYTDGSIGFSIESFNERQWNLKMEALEKAQEIVQNIPEGNDTQQKKMKFLYNYVCENVAYVEYDDGDRPDYLYDAVCEGQSICDGYSNMLLLLYNLAGINCCEAMGDDTEDEGVESEAGHTWVVAEYEGKFYNFDPTYDSDIGEDFAGYACFFAVSDSVIDVLYFDHEDMKPICDEFSGDIECADLVVSDLGSFTEIQKVAEFTDKRAKEGLFTTLVAYQGVATEKEVDDFATEYIETTDVINYVTYTYQTDKARTLILFEAEIQ